MTNDLVVALNIIYFGAGFYLHVRLSRERIKRHQATNDAAKRYIHRLLDQLDDIEVSQRKDRT